MIWTLALFPRPDGLLAAPHLPIVLVQGEGWDLADTRPQAQGAARSDC